MNFSNTTVVVVWYLTIGFFFISIISFFVFFILKWVASHKIELVKRNMKYYQSTYFLKKELPKNNKKRISYIYELGSRMVLTTDELEKQKIKNYIKEKNIISIIEDAYDNSYLKIRRLYYLSLLAVLSSNSNGSRFKTILNDNQISFECITLALYNKSIRCKNSDDLLVLYKYLKHIYINRFVDRRFVQFYFVIAIKDISYTEINKFLDDVVNDSIHIPTIIAFIYALSQNKKNKILLSTFMNIQKYYKNNTELTVAIMRLFASWNVKSNRIVLDNYESKNDIVRLTCAKLGFDLLNKTKYYKLSCYLYDPNIVVRNNFNNTFHKYGMSSKEISEMLVEKYNEVHNLKYFMNSCIEDK
jgi:hypothetical protein